MQNTFSRPPWGVQPRNASAPCTTRTDPGSARAVAAAPDPVRRWQRVQWQYDAERNGRATSKRTAPQPQPPTIGSFTPTRYVSRGGPCGPQTGGERFTDEHEFTSA